jgi:hypothetical protein
VLSRTREVTNRCPRSARAKASRLICQTLVT